VGQLRDVLTKYSREADALRREEGVPDLTPYAVCLRCKKVVRYGERVTCTCRSNHDEED